MIVWVSVAGMKQPCSWESCLTWTYFRLEDGSPTCRRHAEKGQAVRRVG